MWVCVWVVSGLCPGVGASWFLWLCLGGVCRRWCGVLVMPLVRVVTNGDTPGDVVGEGVGGAGGVGAAGDCVVDGALWLVWWRGCCC